MLRLFLFFSLLWTFFACAPPPFWETPAAGPDWKVKALPASSQNSGGDPEAGLHYLVYGDYIGSGVPFEVFRKRFLLPEADTVLGREGDNARLPYVFNAFTAANGQKVVSGNCFTCHAGVLNGKVVLGLGNHNSQYQKSLHWPARLLGLQVRTRYGKKSDEYAAFEDFGHYFKAITPAIKTRNPNVNPAFRLEEACVQYRNPEDLSYRKGRNFRMDKLNIGSDVPPLWNVKKKHALYYNAMGRGDFSKLVFQASVLGIDDSAAAREALLHFQDVVAWLNDLEPPPYPGEIDRQLATEGEKVFNLHCSKCHGTYGPEETYPNKLVSLQVVKTDPVYAQYLTQASHLSSWYNASWFANSPPFSRLMPEAGYIAPPLDGIWASAPYLHNGSVPTLADLLNSTERPLYWKKQQIGEREFAYDYQKLGWRYTKEKKGKDRDVYDATLPGYGNGGHTFGDKLNDNEREALLEYLKGI